MEMILHIDGLMQERRNSGVLAMELRLSCINPSICSVAFDINCECKKDLTPLLMHWSYIFLALTHRYVV